MLICWVILMFLGYSVFSLVFATLSAFCAIGGVVKFCGPDGLRAMDSRNVDTIDWTYRFCHPSTRPRGN